MRRISVSLMALAAIAVMASVVLADGTAGCGMKQAEMKTGAVKAAETQSSTAMTPTSAYSVDYCIVSGEKLGATGEPVVRTLEGREVRFCSEQCAKMFEKDEAAYMKKLDAAVVSSERASYPLQTCVVSGEKLGGMGEPVDYVYDNHLVRFCCSGCISAFEKEPAKYMKAIEQAREARTTKAQTMSQ